MSLIEIKVPDIGDFSDVAVIEVLVKPGDTVRTEQSLLTVESDKASMEIPSSHAGVVKELKVALGDKVSQGSLVLLLEVAGEAAALEPAASAVPVASGSPAPDQVPAQARQAQAAAVLEVASAGPVELRVPDIGDFKDVVVIEVMVKVGDAVKAEQSLITVESDKASMEIPASAAGVIGSLLVKLGDKVNQGDLLARLVGASSVTGDLLPIEAPALISPSNVAITEIAKPMVSAPAHQPGGTVLGLPHASPSVRKFARQLGVPLSEVKGSGPKGRISEADVQAFTRSVMGGAVQTAAIAAVQQAAKPAAPASSDGAALGLIPWPKVDFAKFGPIERKELSRIKKISGANLLRNAIMIPAVTNHDDADITDLEAFRVATNKENEKSGVKVTMLAFLIKACVAALKKFPDFNSSLDGDALVYKQYYHIGFAADTPNGLMVPVIKDADKKGIFQISTEMSELAKKARDGKLSPTEMTGATFTISSLGGIGGRYFTPIINAPEVAILGVCRSTIEPVWDGKVFQPRLMLPLSLTWDHRVIDGAAAARFNVYLGQILGDFRRVLL
ncbi:MAG: dihydrolipoyllysine-residue acetyltransferase [Rhodoferax sp.]|uniref:dihydrolipoyllysine-residue acetyltransferase n=1 Tax=Rhodoferax sp. TaxID=50421 RepID=UPI001B435D39|nr:dihydrolipoyllysine-residue acetyltransferase [Rhodoferax sp.]MBP9906464.1 dihydrolipoyllysine-residue acetyltransferase [Rhodoferax sp.]